MLKQDLINDKGKIIKEYSSDREIILTIAIPTYNRKKLLQKTLESVLAQRTNQVEVLVSDNASQDGTEKMLLKYQEKGLITYYRNSTNLGMDGNFLNCFKQAKGKYIQLLSDDDLLLDGAVDYVLERISQYAPDYIHLNAFAYSAERYCKSNKREGWIQLDREMISVDKKEYLSKIGIYITFLSSIVLKRENILPIGSLEKYVGTYFLQSHAVLAALRGNNKKVIISQTAYVASKGGNSGGYNLYQVWVREYKRLLLITAVKAGAPYELMLAQYRKDMCGKIRAFIFQFRTTKNQFDLKNRRILLKETFRYPEVVRTVFPVAFLPKKVLKLCKKWR